MSYIVELQQIRFCLRLMGDEWVSSNTAADWQNMLLLTGGDVLGVAF